MFFRSLGGRQVQQEFVAIGVAIAHFVLWAEGQLFPRCFRLRYTKCNLIATV